MALYNYQELQEKVFNSSNENIYKIICSNIKKLRKERYNEFKSVFQSNSINPYTTENIAALLDYNHNHYKRFESDNDPTKRIPLNKLILLTIILDTTLDEIIKDKSKNDSY